ncbi:hypothetical protein GCM10010236_37580 [Streptomyces eurythermus]|nr:hypothetical protein GCM10010236_37580 [Streptomyces eurythermus]
MAPIFTPPAALVQWVFTRRARRPVGARSGPFRGPDAARESPGGGPFLVTVQSLDGKKLPGYW